jgi:RNA 2',3'-cyclic 3'-phosphodiesterase
MAKLFVAVDLPAAVAAELALIQPPQMSGVRLVSPDQMHLTLHYLGKGSVKRMASALQSVTVPAFSLVIEGVGQFSSTDGGVTLWAGIAESRELLRLHAAVAVALAGEGFQPEARPYTPHVTLARCAPGVPANVVDEFRPRNERLSLPEFLIKEFGLYSSTFIGEVPVYRRERSFSLPVAAGGPS